MIDQATRNLLIDCRNIIARNMGYVVGSHAAQLVTRIDAMLADNSVSKSVAKRVGIQRDAALAGAGSCKPVCPVCGGDGYVDEARPLCGPPRYLDEPAPNCGACPGDGSICISACRVESESPPMGQPAPSDVERDAW